MKLTMKSNQYLPDPRQDAFKTAYYDPNSTTYSNAFQSALAVGYSVSTAKDLLHNKPKWLSEKWGGNSIFEPEDLLLKLAAIVEDPGVTTRDKLKAIELMIKNRGMLKDGVNVTKNVLNIQAVLD